MSYSPGNTLTPPSQKALSPFSRSSSPTTVAVSMAPQLLGTPPPRDDHGDGNETDVSGESRNSVAAPNDFIFCLPTSDASLPPPPPLLYRRRINTDATATDETPTGRMARSRAALRVNYSAMAAVESPTKASWRDRLSQVSTYASILCVLDCTILPIVTVVFPLLGLLTMTPQQEHFVHELGHAMALRFVLPVGFTASTLNYSLGKHSHWQFLAMAYLGLTLVFASNVGCSGHFVHAVEHTLPHPIGEWIHDFIHMVAHGWRHRLCNIVGCSLLLASNYFAQLYARRKSKDGSITGGLCWIAGCCLPKQSNGRGRDLVFEIKQPSL
jgi:MerC mercury resistance protein